MRKGISLEAETEGTGAAAVKGSTVTLRYSGYLHRGDAFQKDLTCTFRLGRREVIAGLEYAVEGMRVGGRRRVQIAPHLAYREAGVPGVIPANALLTFDLELLEVVGP